VFRLTLRNIARRKLRYALTTLAVVLGVAFLSTAFFLTDRIRDTFDELAVDIAGDMDLVVRTSVGDADSLNRLPVPAELEALVADVPGVAAVDPRIVMWNVIPIIPADGDDDPRPVPTAGAPQFGMIYSDVPGLSQLFLTDGRAPENVGPLHDDPTLVGEFVLDARTADDHGFTVGDEYTVTGPTGNRQFVLVGIVNFGAPDENKTVGASITAFDRGTAQEFLGMEGRFDQIDVAVADGADQEQVLAEIQTRLDAATAEFQAMLADQPEEIREMLGPVADAELEVITSATQIEESRNDFDQFVSIISSVLLAFAIIAVVVSAFIINNTFSIVLGQRVRELALLRALGATGRQVSRSIRLEGVIIGSVATLIGLIGGYLLAMLMRWLLVANGFGELPGDIPIRVRTIVIAVVVGVGVTVASSIAPSRRVRSIPPVAALRDDFRLTPTGLRRRLRAGGLVTLGGIALLAVGMSAELATRPLLFCLGVGALGTFLGVYLLSPVVARPVADLIGRPLERLFRIPGRLARENARRSPRRTAATAAALTVGLALVSLAAVVSNSMKATFVKAIEESLESDLFVYTAGFNPTAGFPTEMTDELVALTESNPDTIASVAVYRAGIGGLTIDGTVKDVFGTDLDLIDRHLDLDVVAGDVATAPAPGATETVLIHVDPADDLDVGVGSLITGTFPGDRDVVFSVAAVIADSTMLGNWVVDNGTFDRYLPKAPDNSMSVAFTAGADRDAARAVVETVTDQYPQAMVSDGNQLRQEMEGQLDQLLSIITVFLGLSLLIAVLGITNTLALSVHERTRELGLLRAVGMTRRQLRRMVRWEAVIIAVFGGLLGVGIGVLFGLAAIAAIPETFVDVVSVPNLRLLGYLGIAALFGMLAAVFPARRASRLDVLDAISHT